jgi:tRNA pseudouridine38-40 synthase
MRTILLKIEYDGTDYAGWQVQPNGLTIQEVVEKALEKIMGQDVRLHSSGRTDAGVHAHCMAAHFRTESDLPLKAFREGVNSQLPADIAVLSAQEMPADFHARFAAKGKWYRYTIYSHEVRSPLAARSTWHLRGNLDIEKMKQAAESLVGEHDFAAFRSSSCAAKRTVRELFQVDISAEGDFVYLDFRGSGFLKNMVRMLVGTLVEIGQGRRPVDDVSRLLAKDQHISCGITAPAHGLCLKDVWY